MGITGKEEPGLKEFLGQPIRIQKISKLVMHECVILTNQILHSIFFVLSFSLFLS